MMIFTWIEDFLALASTGNFSRAAEERHMTQPAFSRRVRALEEWMGVELFDRSSQPARLTRAGEWFRTVAEQLVNQVARIPSEAQAVAHEDAATLHFAATHALSFTFMPGWLRSLEARTLIGPIQLVSDVMQRCESLLQQGKVHFVLCHAHPLAASPLDAAGYPSERIGRDALIPVSAATGKGLARHILDTSGEVPLLAYSAESGLGRILRGVLGKQLGPLPITTVFTAHLASVLKTMALDGRGVAWLPQSLIAAELASGQLMPAGAKDWNIELDIRLYRNQGPLGEVAEHFWDDVQRWSASPTPQRRSRQPRP